MAIVGHVESKLLVFTSTLEECSLVLCKNKDLLFHLPQVPNFAHVHALLPDEITQKVYYLTNYRLQAQSVSSVYFERVHCIA